MTIWYATATVRQDSHDAYACASLTFMASEPSSTTTIAKAAWYSTLLSVVFTASAWLSPSSGASGLSTGKTQPSFAVVDGVATSPPPPPTPVADAVRGTSTTASWGDSFVGGGVRISQR